MVVREAWLATWKLSDGMEEEGEVAWELVGDAAFDFLLSM